MAAANKAPTSTPRWREYSALAPKEAGHLRNAVRLYGGRGYIRPRVPATKKGQAWPTCQSALGKLLVDALFATPALSKTLREVRVTPKPPKKKTVRVLPLRSFLRAVQEQRVTRTPRRPDVDASVPTGTTPVSTADVTSWVRNLRAVTENLRELDAECAQARRRKRDVLGAIVPRVVPEHEEDASDDDDDDHDHDAEGGSDQDPGDHNRVAPDRSKGSQRARAVHGKVEVGATRYEIATRQVVANTLGKRRVQVVLEAKVKAFLDAEYPELVDAPFHDSVFTRVRFPALLRVLQDTVDSLVRALPTDYRKVRRRVSVDAETVAR